MNLELFYGKDVYKRQGDKCLDIGLLKHWGTNLCGVCIPQEGAAEGFFFGLKHFQV